MCVMRVVYFICSFSITCALLYVLCAFVILNKDYLLTVDGRAFQLRGLEQQSAGQCDFRSVSADLPPASENILILGFLPLYCR